MTFKTRPNLQSASPSHNRIMINLTVGGIQIQSAGAPKSHCKHHSGWHFATHAALKDFDGALALLISGSFVPRWHPKRRFVALSQ